MNLFKKAVKPTSIFLTIVFLLVSTSSQSASAAMIGTEKLLPAQNPQDRRDRLLQLIAREEIVPEFIQGAATRDRIAAALAPLFRGEARQRQIEALDRARDRLGSPGAARRTAAIVEEMLGTPAT